jgi:hypothetical protein
MIKQPIPQAVDFSTQADCLTGVFLQLAEIKTHGEFSLPTPPSISVGFCTKAENRCENSVPSIEAENDFDGLAGQSGFLN